MKDIKVQIETLLHENAPDFEIAKILKKDIKINTLAKNIAEKNFGYYQCV